MHGSACVFICIYANDVTSSGEAFQLVSQTSTEKRDEQENETKNIRIHLLRARKNSDRKEIRLESRFLQKTACGGEKVVRFENLSTKRSSHPRRATHSFPFTSTSRASVRQLRSIYRNTRSQKQLAETYGNKSNG